MQNMVAEDTEKTKEQNQVITFAGASSRITGFAKMTPAQRVSTLKERGLLNQGDEKTLNNMGPLESTHADSFIENCIGGFQLPLGIATNFIINGNEILIPMAVEESSVIAAASHGAKLARAGGGFITQPTSTIATAQVQIFSSLSFNKLNEKIQQLEPEFKIICQNTHPNLILRGGGLIKTELRKCEFTNEQNAPLFFILHLHVNTSEAMGANIVNTLAEEIGKFLPSQFENTLECKIGLKILTNLTTERITRALCQIPFSALEISGFKGNDAATRIICAYEFAALDIYRAATHNKGIMNGVDPVVIATGNDWRAVEAGAHAFASVTGRYKPLTQWKIEGNYLLGEINIPIAIGTVGGVTKLHPTARTCLGILGFPSADRLSGIIASVGLAQNLSALRALACEGIQKGHMALHEKNHEMLKMYDHTPAKN
jgi:hydroxymethylglutaryl-CoA reductase